MCTYVGNLSPNGTVLVSSGSQVTFTCMVTGQTAVWSISGFRSIVAVEESGLSAAQNNPRITSSDSSSITANSTITIIGFTVDDDGGTIQCINGVDSSVQGTATISLGEWLPVLVSVLMNFATYVHVQYIQ